MHSRFRLIPAALLPPVTCLICPVGQVPSSTSTFTPDDNLPGPGSAVSVCEHAENATAAAPTAKTLLRFISLSLQADRSLCPDLETEQKCARAHPPFGGRLCVGSYSCCIFRSCCGKCVVNDGRGDAELNAEISFEVECAECGARERLTSRSMKTRELFRCIVCGMVRRLDKDELIETCRHAARRTARRWV